MTAFIIYFIGFAFTYGFTMANEENPSIPMQIVIILLCWFTWPLVLGFLTGEDKPDDET